MSLFIAGAMAGASLLAGFLIGLSEKLRSSVRRQRLGTATELHERQRQDGVPAAASLPDTRRGEDTAETRAAAYREILDALGDDLDQDTAEWEALLQDFPQVSTEQHRETDERLAQPIVETTSETARPAASPKSEPVFSQSRTRRILAEERGMIHRLSRSGFAPEEIALWLNLPVERVHELLFRDGLT